jgi:cyclopropane fatty-acyl-phospholipid synthase-like methyltransferase
MPKRPEFARPVDVVMCYRHFLRREPENSEVIERHLSDRPTIFHLVQRFASSDEHEPKKIDEGCSGIWRRQDGRDVCVEASAAARTEILNHVEKIWSMYGTEDPYYSVLTDPAYRADKITFELAEKFYQSGLNDLANLRLAFERNRIEIDPSWHILDLGCGMGRIGEHFSQDFEHYCGVDISANHLAHAVKRFQEKHITNATFMLLKDAINQYVKFDLFYSMIVIQHNPPPVMYYLLDLFLSKLRPNGFAFFQLPCHLYGYSFNSDCYLAGQGKHDAMEMHALPQKYVFEALYRNGLQPIEVWPFPVIGPIGISYLFFARKLEKVAADR